MFRKNKKITALLAVVSLVALVGCDEDEFRYPENYDKVLVNAPKADGKDVEIAQNTYKQYYQSLTNDNAVYEKATKDIFVRLSEKVHNYDATTNKGSATYDLVNDTYEGSVADGYEAHKSEMVASGTSNLLKRAQDTFVSTARGSSYEKDNLFIESEYAKYLNENYYYCNIDTDKVKNDGIMVTPTMEFDDIYTQNVEGYTQYMEKELYDDMKLNYLTVEYIYNKTYASIGNSNARNVEIIAIADRSDEPGDAKQLLTAYVRDFIHHEYFDDEARKAEYEGYGLTEDFFKDDEFYVLQKLWKGITRDDALKYGGVGRYGDEVVLSEQEENWLRANKILTSDSARTLTGKINEDEEKLEDGKENWLKLDSSLESSYTGSYTYDTKTGLQKAVDDIATRDLITKGLYLKSSGISSIPSTLSDRIFSPKISTSKNTIDAMKAEPGTRKDLTVYAEDGFRYVTVADTISGDETSDIVYYDASSKTYYITRLLDAVDTNALPSKAANDSTGSYDTIYDTVEKRQQIAREVAYAMSTTGSYKTDAQVYWLSRLNFTFFDEEFLDYIKSNYKDVFKTENPYQDETVDPKISLLDPTNK